MRSLLRPATLFLLLTYLLLSAIPFVPYLLGKPFDRPAQMLGAECISWLGVWAICKRPAWFHILLLPAFIAVPAEIYLFMYYGQGISTHHLGIIMETSPKEAMEFLGSKVWLMGAVMIAVLVWWWGTWRIARRTRELDWNDASRWVVIALLLVGTGLWSYGAKYGIAEAKAAAKPAAPSAAASASSSTSTSTVSADASGFGDDASDEVETAEEDSASAVAASGNGAASAGATLLANPLWPKDLPALPHWSKMPFEMNLFVRSWPFGVMARGIDFYNERSYLANLSKKSASFSFGAKQGHDTAQTVIMVIGESSRYDRWSLNGYERETNPLLKTETNLISLADVITAVSATRLSVPVILSRKPATQSLKDGFSEKSFLTAYKEAGFKTYWLSNQISFGEFDTPVSVFAKEADVVQFMNLGGYTDTSNFDQILLDPLKNAMADPAPKKLIVLHSLGSHWNYSHRHPAQFNKWTPSLFGVDKPVYTDLKIKPQLNNSYDNSILYTDWFLSHVIQTLKASSQMTSMLYVADHGQTLYDGACNLAFHGHNTQFEFHVPALMWYSDQYQAAYPDKVAQLRKNRKARIATENIFHSLLDMGDIRYPGEKLDWSFFSKQFKQHKRYVDSYGWTNYDNATIKGDCREVIDKNKPLEQER
jgi:glucan phosphoethanolaminetransferase (alkaline phosphatase superfamily)